MKVVVAAVFALLCAAVGAGPTSAGGQAATSAASAASELPVGDAATAAPVGQEGVLPSGFFDESVVTLSQVAVSFARHRDGRVFLASKEGIVRVVVDGKVRSTPVIDIHDHVNIAVDRGLLGIALDREFDTNGYLYLAYVYENHGAPQSTDPRTACISRVTVVGNTASTTSETPILGKAGCGRVDSCDDLPAGADCLSADTVSHSVGAIRVGADGTLWTTMGDGSPYNDVRSIDRAQNLDHLNGKLLRVTRDGEGVPGNPFWNGNPDANRSKVYAYGLRNPYRFTLRDGVGPAFLGDVGQSQWEEVDVATGAGENFGWPCYEAGTRYRPFQSTARCQALYAAGSAAHTLPLAKYPHDGGSAGITGGDFFPGGGPPELAGAYFYSDFIKREIYAVKVNAASTAVTSGPTLFGPSVGAMLDMHAEPDGCLWYLGARYGGAPDPPSLRRICHTEGNVAPTAHLAASRTSGSLPLAVQFSSEGSSDADGDPLTYRWTFGDGATSTAANPSHTFTTSANRTVTLTVRDGRGGSASESMVVYAGDRPPVPVIDTPVPAYRFAVGDTVRFSGHATDPDQGTLAAARLRWTAELVHCPGGTTDCHTHSLVDRTGVTSGSWPVDDHGDSYRFRLSLTATDARGLSTTVVREIEPRTVTVTLATDTAGLDVVFDELTRAAPYGFEVILGSKHLIELPSPQKGRVFKAWSDGRARRHTITADGDRTITAETRPK
jgi:glucose/arabinose dehydrogenase